MLKSKWSYKKSPNDQEAKRISHVISWKLNNDSHVATLLDI